MPAHRSRDRSRVFFACARRGLNKCHEIGQRAPSLDRTDLGDGLPSALDDVRRVLFAHAVHEPAECLCCFGGGNAGQPTGHGVISVNFPHNPYLTYYEVSMQVYPASDVLTAP